MLRRVAAAAREDLRGSDLACRVGGEEFAIVLPETGKRAARAAADRLCARVRALPGVRPTTVSCGVATSRSTRPRHRARWPRPTPPSTSPRSRARTARQLHDGRSGPPRASDGPRRGRGRSPARPAGAAGRTSGRPGRSEQIAAAARELLVDADLRRGHRPPPGAGADGRGLAVHRGAPQTETERPPLSLPLSAAGRELGSMEFMRTSPGWDRRAGGADRRGVGGAGRRCARTCPRPRRGAARGRPRRRPAADRGRRDPRAVGAGRRRRGRGRSLRASPAAPRHPSSPRPARAAADGCWPRPGRRRRDRCAWRRRGGRFARDPTWPSCAAPTFPPSAREPPAGMPWSRSRRSSAAAWRSSATLPRADPGRRRGDRRPGPRVARARRADGDAARSGRASDRRRAARRTKTGSDPSWRAGETMRRGSPGRARARTS